MEPRKRDPGLPIDELRRIFDTEPDDYEVAWNELKHRIIETEDHARQTVPTLAPSALSLVDAQQMFSYEQLTAYIGAIHAHKKDQWKRNTIVYGAASDGLSFRFCRIDNESKWSESRPLEWPMGDKDKIYTVFRALIREAALSSVSIPSTTDPHQRRHIRVAFGSPERDQQFQYDLSALEITEEDDETEIISFGECS